ncbi:MAG: hypothetical protein JWM80_3487 [Cyanobacteria bacterium RYN_339]|nr:hypothetical protein [Cyanobacteria bacterium RYN_339]
MTTTQKARHTLTIISDTEIEIQRTFNAPARLVFEAWTKPEYMARWYGCAAMTMVACEIDARTGGSYRWTLRMPDGSEHNFKGVYRELVPPSKMVCTEAYLLGDTWTNDLVNNVSMVEADEKTTVTNRVVYASQADRDGHLGSGMENGMAETFDRLDEFLQTLK